jgi:large repetitive protein
VIVTDWSQLSAQLQATLVTPTAGQLLTGTVIGSGSGVGADGGYVDQLVVDGVTYAFNQTAHTITASNGSTPVFNNTSDVLTVTTSHGGVFVVHLDNGAYTYTAPAGMTSAFTENIGVRLHDADGDLASGTLYLDVARAQGGIANDTITGSAASDLIIGGAGNDTMSGLAGSDTFRWVLGDQGTTATPAQDTVTDFNSTAAASGGDILDLRDLLVGEVHAGTDTGNLANYLHFSYDSGANATTVNVSSHAVGVDQVITLQGVNLIGSLTTDQAVIQDLLNKGKLITD